MSKKQFQNDSIYLYLLKLDYGPSGDEVAQSAKASGPNIGVLGSIPTEDDPKKKIKKIKNRRKKIKNYVLEEKNKKQ